MESHTKVFEALLRPEALQGLLRPYKATSGPQNFIRPVSSFRTLALLRSKRFDGGEIRYSADNEGQRTAYICGPRTFKVMPYYGPLGRLLFAA